MGDEIVRAANAKKGSPFLNTDQAAHYVGLSRRTLEKMRTAGGGPRFRKHGRYVRYHIDDLDGWSAEHGKASTSEPHRQRPAHPENSGARR
jgi:excisionase family DNA binding protein